MQKCCVIFLKQVIQEVSSLLVKAFCVQPRWHPQHSYICCQPRCNGNFLVKENVNPPEIRKRPSEYVDDSCLSCLWMFKLLTDLKNGCELVSNLKHS